MIYKCRHCNQVKESDDFPPSEKTWYRQCRTERAREKRGGVKSPRFDLENGNRICFKCGKEKTLDKFLVNKKCSRGHERKCKECAREDKVLKFTFEPEKEKKYKQQKKEWYENNKELCFERANASIHKRRKWAQLNGRNYLTAEQIREVKSTGMCYYCKGTFNKLSIDHVIPLSKGGENTLENIVAACLECNKRKNAKLVEELT